MNSALLSRLLLSLAITALGGCGCKDGTPDDMKPTLMTDAAGNRYFVEHHMGCVFRVKKVQ